MSNIIAKIRQRIALKDNNKFDLSCDHLTTADFFQLSPVYFKEMVPGEKIKIKMSTFTRLAPMTNPVLGRMRIENRAFFVPMRTIMKHWNEFITDTPVNSEFIGKVPQIDPHALAVALGRMCRQSSATGDVTEATADFAAYNNQGNVENYYRFNDDGRQAWKILCSLGYKIDLTWYINHTVSDINTEYLSALPLLAFLKIYYDWYKPQAYSVGWFDGIFDLQNENLTTFLNSETLAIILGFCSVVNYDKDYFSSAWDRPVSPNTGLSSGNTIVDVTNDSSSAQQYRSTIKSAVTPGSNLTPTTPVVSNGGNSNSYVANLSQYALDALKSLTDYLKRHQLAGGLAMDRMLSRFGMKPSDAALSRSVYIGKDTVNIQIADVMSTAAGADTVDNKKYNSKLGEYAGKGIGFSENGYFNYDTNEYGYIVILSSLVPKIGYVQGTSRYNMHLSRLDFFTPEFDSLGVQAIARKELLSNYGLSYQELGTYGPAQLLDGVFGYTSRYAEYKTQQDNLTGDFALPSKSGGDWNRSWHLFREINTQGATPTSLSHNLAFVSPTDASQYSRIFAYTGTGYDHFVVTYNFQIEDYAPMAQLFDDYQFDGGKKEVTIDVNGTQLN